ncbi:MAG: hypothetical protein MUF38_14905 [Anaerolineae bacterium]|jgi:hypothetical protein|nr:hypothetical protein [Anaerolineae bacterium]
MHLFTEVFPLTQRLIDEAEPGETPQETAARVLKGEARLLRLHLRDTARRSNATLPAADTFIRFERDVRLQPWAVGDAPALSIGLTTRMVYGRDAAEYAKHASTPNALVGMRVALPETGQPAEVLAVMDGTLAEQREKLAKQKLASGLTKFILTAPESPVLRLRVRGSTIRLPSAGLELVLRPEDIARVGADGEEGQHLLRPDPSTRADLVRSLSDVMKSADLIGRAFASREQPDRFIIPTEDDRPFLRYGGGRTRAAQPNAMPRDLAQFGPFRVRDRHRANPIRVGVVNAAGEKLADFIEALRRLLAKRTEFQVDVARERTIRVLTLDNLEAAVRVIEKERPDLVLVFLPEPEVGAEDVSGYVKTLALSRGLPAHLIPREVIDDPEAMPALVAAILTRTGSTPAALADPIENFDEVVGLSFVKRMEGEQEYRVGVARFYQPNGVFIRWAMREVDVQGDAPPYVLMRALFSQKHYTGKRILIHADGQLDEDTRRALTVWGTAIQAHFAFVEVRGRGAPRVYGFDERGVTHPPGGAAFVINQREAFVILNEPPPAPPPPTFTPGKRPVKPYAGATPQPLHIAADGLPIREAVEGVRRFALLDDTGAAVMPVTVLNTDQLTEYLASGGALTATDGESPFWL